MENSTSVITVRVSNNSGKFDSDKEIFSFDFAIVIENDKGSFITRRNDDNHCVWNKTAEQELVTYTKQYFSFRLL